MSKATETRRLEQALYFHCRKIGTYCCFEMSVGFKFQDVERVDFITYNRNQEFRCYEIKVSKSDFFK